MDPNEALTPFHRWVSDQCFLRNVEVRDPVMDIQMLAGTGGRPGQCRVWGKVRVEGTGSTMQGSGLRM